MTPLEYIAQKTNVELVIAIVNRGEELAKKHRVDINRMSSVLDMTAAYRSHRIDLAAMLEADDFNFAHDFFGIRNHMDRRTGELKDCFVPRFARAAA